MYFFGFLREGGVCAPSDTELDVGAHRSAAEISVDINHTGQNKYLKQLISSEKFISSWGEQTSHYARK